MIGPPALHEAQIVSVIHDTGKIRVLVIDADLQIVSAVADRAVERGISLRHRRGRRRGDALASDCVPPGRASQSAASRSTNAFKASRTSADFSFNPVYSCALANNSSSMAMVVRIGPAPLLQI